MDVIADGYSILAGWGAATNAQLLVAIATLTLALFTYRSVLAANRSAEATVHLANAADHEVEAARKQNALAERTLLASIQPVLSDFPKKPSTESSSNVDFSEMMLATTLPDDWVPWADTQDEHFARTNSLHLWSHSMLPQAPPGETAWAISTLFKNVGNGVAIVERAYMELADSIPAYQLRISKLLIAQGDYCRVTFNVANRDFPDPLQQGSVGRNYAKPDFFVDISYGNASGTGRLRTRQRIQITHGTPHIAALEIWDQESGHQLAVSEYVWHFVRDDVGAG